MSVCRFPLTHLHRRTTHFGQFSTPRQRRHTDQVKTQQADWVRERSLGDVGNYIHRGFVILNFIV